MDYEPQEDDRAERAGEVERDNFRAVEREEHKYDEQHGEA